MENSQIELIKLAQKVAIAQFQIELMGRLDVEEIKEAKEATLKALGITN